MLWEVKQLANNFGKCPQHIIVHVYLLLNLPYSSAASAGTKRYVHNNIIQSRYGLHVKSVPEKVAFKSNLF